jgi:hypothetical protein
MRRNKVQLPKSNTTIVLMGLFILCGAVSCPATARSAETSIDGIIRSLRGGFLSGYGSLRRDECEPGRHE